MDSYRVWPYAQPFHCCFAQEATQHPILLSGSFPASRRNGSKDQRQRIEACRPTAATADPRCNKGPKVQGKPSHQGPTMVDPMAKIIRLCEHGSEHGPRCVRHKRQTQGPSCWESPMAQLAVYSPTQTISAQASWSQPTQSPGTDVPCGPRFHAPAPVPDCPLRLGLRPAAPIAEERPKMSGPRASVPAYGFGFLAVNHRPDDVHESLRLRPKTEQWHDAASSMNAMRTTMHKVCD